MAAVLALAVKTAFSCNTPSKLMGGLGVRKNQRGGVPGLLLPSLCPAVPGDGCGVIRGPFG